MNLTYLDLETSGLDSHRHEILEIGIVSVSPGERLAWEAVIEPRHFESASPAALEVNCWHERLAGAEKIPLRDALGTLVELLEDADEVRIWDSHCGSGRAFDARFLGAAFAEIVRDDIDETDPLGDLEREWATLADYRLRNVAPAVAAAVGLRGRRRGLTAAAVELGVSIDDARRHTALGDAELLERVCRAAGV